MKRERPHAGERRVRDEGTSALPLFAPSQDFTERDLERLVSLAQELALKAGAGGVTIADVRIHAVNRGILTGEEKGRKLSFLGSLLSRAGLVANGVYRRSSIGRSHGNLHAVHVLPEFAPPLPATRREA